LKELKFTPYPEGKTWKTLSDERRKDIATVVKFFIEAYWPIHHPDLVLTLKLVEAEGKTIRSVINKRNADSKNNAIKAVKRRQEKEEDAQSKRPALDKDESISVN